MRPTGAGLVSALACLCLVAGCSAGSTGSGKSSSPESVSGLSQGSEPTPGAGSPTTTPPAQETQPLVVVRHATLPRPRLDLARARRLVAHHDPARPASVVLRRVIREPGVLGVLPADQVDARVRTALVDGVDPLRHPRRYPLQVGGPTPPRPVTLTVAGDVMLTRGVKDPAAALAPLRRRLAGADLTVANLESTLSRAGEPTQGGDSFGADPRVVRLLAHAGLDAVSLANNHTGDYGPTALVETVRRLRSSRVRPFGAGVDRDSAARPAVLRRGGVSFGFLGFNAIGETPAATATRAGALSVSMPPRTGPLVRAELEALLEDVARLARRVDVVVVLPHWGTQYTHRPEPVQRLVGRRLVEAGADLVVGGHPHWVQGLEWHRGRVLAHSLGNFVFDMDFMRQTMQGVLLEATFWGPQLKSVDLVPYQLDAGFAPRRVAGPVAVEVLAQVWGSSTGPFSAQ